MFFHYVFKVILFMIQLYSSCLKVDRINAPEVTNTTFLLGSKTGSFFTVGGSSITVSQHPVGNIKIINSVGAVTAVKLSGIAKKVQGRSVRTEQAL